MVRTRLRVTICVIEGVLGEMPSTIGRTYFLINARETSARGLRFRKDKTVRTRTTPVVPRATGLCCWISLGIDYHSYGLRHQPCRGDIGSLSLILTGNMGHRARVCPPQAYRFRNGVPVPQVYRFNNAHPQTRHCPCVPKASRPNGEDVLGSTCCRTKLTIASPTYPPWCGLPFPPRSL